LIRYFDTSFLAPLSASFAGSEMTTPRKALTKT
jgi:hypothetical protein